MMTDRVIWVSSAPTPQFAPVLAALGQQLNLEVLHFDDSDRGRGWGDFTGVYPYSVVGTRAWQVRFLARLVADRPRAIVALGYSRAFSWMLLLAARLLRVRVFTLSDSSWAYEAQKPEWRLILKRMFLRIVFPSGTRVWTIGSDNAAYWTNFGFANQRRVPFESPLPEARAIERPANTRVVLFVGRIAPEKGVQDAVTAVQRLSRNRSDVELWIIGGGPDEDRYVGAEHVRILGRVPHAELGGYLTSADCLVVPSTREPYGLVVPEALQFGLPVVGTRCVPSLLELCDRGWNVVDPGDPAGLARALGEALNQPRWSPRKPKCVLPILFKELDAANLNQTGG